MMKTERWDEHRKFSTLRICHLGMREGHGPEEPRKFHEMMLRQTQKCTYIQYACDINMISSIHDTWIPESNITVDSIYNQQSVVTPLSTIL